MGNSNTTTLAEGDSANTSSTNNKMTESRDPHPLTGTLDQAEAQKKRLSHVGVKATSELLSEVRTGSKEAIKKHVAPVSKQDVLSAVRKEGHETKKRLSHVAPVSKQDVLSAVRKEGNDSKRNLKHVATKDNSALMNELRHSKHDKE